MSKQKKALIVVVAAIIVITITYIVASISDGKKKEKTLNVSKLYGKRSQIQSSYVKRQSLNLSSAMFLHYYSIY